MGLQKKILKAVNDTHGIRKLNLFFLHKNHYDRKNDRAIYQKIPYMGKIYNH